MSRPLDKLALNAATGTGASNGFDTHGHSNVTMTVTSTGTTGATVKLQGSADGTNWFDLDTITVTGNGTLFSNTEEYAKLVRANITALTDGTHTVRINGSDFSGVA